MKLNLVSASGEKSTAEVALKWGRTRNGFSHTALAVVEGELVSARVSYYNRTWESHPYQTAVHRLCRKIAERRDGRTKAADAYAETLIAQADGQWW